MVRVEELQETVPVIEDIFLPGDLTVCTRKTAHPRTGPDEGFFVIGRKGDPNNKGRLFRGDWLVVVSVHIDISSDEREADHIVYGAKLGTEHYYWYLLCHTQNNVPVEIVDRG